MRFGAFLRRLQPHYGLYDRLGLTYAKGVEQPLSFVRRIQGVLTFAKVDTHAELNAQKKQDNRQPIGGNKHE